MTLLDLINTLPHWLQILVCVVLLVWFIEIFLIPFKLNLLNARLNMLIDSQHDTLKTIKDNNEDINRIYNMLSVAIGSMLRREQKEKHKEVR